MLRELIARYFLHSSTMLAMLPLPLHTISCTFQEYGGRDCSFRYQIGIIEAIPPHPYCRSLIRDIGLDQSFGFKRSSSPLDNDDAIMLSLRMDIYKASKVMLLPVEAPNFLLLGWEPLAGHEVSHANSTVPPRKDSSCFSSIATWIFRCRQEVGRVTGGYPGRNSAEN